MDALWVWIDEPSQRKLTLFSHHTQRTEMFCKRLGSRYPQDEELNKALMAVIRVWLLLWGMGWKSKGTG